MARKVRGKARDVEIDDAAALGSAAAVDGTVGARNQAVEVIGDAVAGEIAPGDSEIRCCAAIQPTQLAQLIGRERGQAAQLRPIKDRGQALPAGLFDVDEIFGKHQYGTFRFYCVQFFRAMRGKLHTEGVRAPAAQAKVWLLDKVLQHQAATGKKCGFCMRNNATA